MKVVVANPAYVSKVESIVGRSLKWDTANGNQFTEVKASEAKELQRWAHVDEDTDDVWITR